MVLTGTCADSGGGIAVTEVSLRGRSESERRRRIISADTRQSGEAESGGRGGVREEGEDEDEGKERLEPVSPEGGVVGSDLERRRKEGSSAWSSWSRWSRSIGCGCGCGCGWLGRKAFSQARRSSH